MVTKPGNLNVRLTAEEARAIEQQATRLGVSKSDIFRMVWRGVIPAFQVQVPRG